ncbi:L-threonylcarbamoyladenylate synthase [Amphibacillus marinus]|uniref:Threonylcarbamoyl-AMP synthase n=1 Tax=Amphibacillus marinus TaxID=872970 RepID=A0A1H8N0Q4_9BACI|nr:L-threonylcarbamoyladenylate synthase [Amphibacillus marinus]SEO23142.1 L-threonylcarbamoyladenylate synthase [Amphibacillus marinus]
MTQKTNFYIWNDDSVASCAELLKAGEVVAFPTETVYGLGADASNPNAVTKIFTAKGRPADNPLIVHVSSLAQMEEYVTDIPAQARKIINTFMPGPITVILPSNGVIADNVTAGLATVGIRIPDHPVAQALIEATNRPIAAPSANLSGKPSPTSAIHVYQDLHGKISAILDGGSTGIGVESTVVDCTGGVPTILRPGGITREQLEIALGIDIHVAKPDVAELPSAPGMKYKHYEPDVPLVLINGDEHFFQEKINTYRSEGRKVGILISEQLANALAADLVQVCGSRDELATVAAHLYQALRNFKTEDVDIILAEVYPETGVGEAIMNRLRKAASFIEIQ